MSRPRVLLLLSTTSYKAEDFLAAADAAGVEVVVGSDHEQVLAELVPGTALRVAFDRIDASVREIEALAGERPLDAVVAAEDEGALLAAAASASLGLPHNPFDAVRGARDKALTRERLDAAGVPGPRWRLLSEDDDPEEVAASLSYPLVLKPRSLSASRGVIRVDGPDAFAAALRRVARILREAEPARTAGIEGPGLLVEEYVPGEEVAVEGILADGELRILAVFDKPDPLEGPFFEETLFVTPSRKSRRALEEIEETTRATAEALGLRHGPVHAELRVSDGRAVPLEIAPRTIGGRCARVLTFGAAMSLEELVLRQAAGLEIPSFQRKAGAAGVMMLPVHRRGRLVEVRGREEAEAVPGIRGLDVTIAPGKEVVPLPEGHRYLGFLYARGESPAAVEEALREAHRRLEVVIEEDPAHLAGRPGPDSPTRSARR